MLLGFWGVSAFLSHGEFCTVWPFDNRDGPHAKVLHTSRKSPGSTPDYVSSKPAPESFCVSSGIPPHRSISAFSPRVCPAQKNARTRHTSFLETI
jgi:hypothetical protein